MQTASQCIGPCEVRLACLVYVMFRNYYVAVFKSYQYLFCVLMVDKL